MQLKRVSPINVFPHRIPGREVSRKPVQPFMPSWAFSFFVIGFSLLCTPALAISDNGLTTPQSSSWQGNFSVRVISPRTETIIFSGKIYQKGLRVRIEPVGAKEIDLYDFEQAVKLRIFPDDKIYFKTVLSIAERMKAAKEGWTTPPKPYTASMLLLRSGQLEEKKVKLYFVTLEREGRKSYSLRWVSDDPLERVLRVVYPGPADETVIVDYAPQEGEALPPEFFIPPPDYLSLNPF